MKERRRKERTGVEERKNGQQTICREFLKAKDPSAFYLEILKCPKSSKINGNLPVKINKSDFTFPSRTEGFHIDTLACWLPIPVQTIATDFIRSRK